MNLNSSSSVEEIRNQRTEVAEKFEGDLPNYLKDYFDEKEQKRIKKEMIEATIEARKGNSWDDIAEYNDNKNKEFWDNNKFRIRKVQRTTDRPNFNKESKRATERIEQEKELTDEERNAIIYACESDLYLFAIRYFPHYLKKKNSEFHNYLYSFLSRNLGGKKKRVRGLKHAIASPRGNSKSTIISAILPIWCTCYNKKKFIIIISDTGSQAEDFLADIKRELEDNEALARDFPFAVGKSKSTWRVDEIVTNNDVKILALGTGKKIRGRRFGVHRPSLLIFDDIEGPDDVRSQANREFIRHQWFNKDAMHVGGEKGTITDFLVVGTVLSKEALLNALLDKNEYPDWTSRRFAAVKKFSESDLWIKWEEIFRNKLNPDSIEDARKFFEDNKEEMLKGTEVLWPEGDPYYDLMVLKLSSPSSFYSEKQNSSSDLSKILIPFENLSFRNFSTDPEIKKIKKRGFPYGAIDPSLGKKAGIGDYSCICSIIRDPKTGVMLVDSFEMKKHGVDSQINSIIRKDERYNYKLFAIETNAFQYVVAENLRKKCRKLGINIPIVEINNYQDKKMRIEGIIPLINDGTIIFDKYKYDNNVQYRLAIDQITTYTGDGDEYDDSPDCLEQTIRIAKKPKFRMITKG